MRLYFLMLISLSFCLSAIGQNSKFEQLNDLINQGDYFRAQALYSASKAELNPIESECVGIILSNAFNEISKSDKMATDFITKYASSVHISVLLRVYDVELDNYLRIGAYDKYCALIDQLVNDASLDMDDQTKERYTQKKALWSLVVNEPRMQVSRKGDVRMPFFKDIANLNNIKIALPTKDSVDFIFDTGANLSIITKSVAKKLNIQTILGSTQVGTPTGAYVDAEVGRCDRFSFGGIAVLNAIFLIVEDQYLAFPQANYQINGIIGFPIISALEELHIENDGYIVVPKKTTKKKGCCALAFSGLTPMIQIQNKYFIFDTGASESVLYYRYFEENKDDITSHLTLSKKTFAAMGGAREVSCYYTPFDVVFQDKKVSLPKVCLYAENIEPDKQCYGHIGQDFLNLFHTTIINFRTMSVDFISGD